MRSLRNIVRTGLAGLVLLSVAAAGSPVYAAPAPGDGTSVNYRAAAAPARPQGRVITLTGSEQRFFNPATSVWQADGWTQVRGVRLTGTFAFSGSGLSLAGTEVVYTNASLDANNNGYTWGWNTYTDTATGLKCAGSANGRITNALGTLAIVAQCRNGAMLVGRVQDVSTDPPNVAPPKSVKSNFDGVYISASGR